MQGVANILDIVVFKVVTITKDVVVLGESVSWEIFFCHYYIKNVFCIRDCHWAVRFKLVCMLRSSFLDLKESYLLTPFALP